MAGEERSSPAGGQQLGATEAENAHIAPGAGRAPLDKGSGHLSRILDDAQVVLAGYGYHLAHRHDAAMEVRDDHRAGFRLHGSA